MYANSVLFLLAAAWSATAITINGPSSSLFWVQDTSNNITWQFNSGDPNPVDVAITNSNDTILNGAFFIQRNLDISNGSFTVTNVTLLVADGYVVNFLNTTNHSQTFASSGSFSVDTPGTAPASASASASSATSPSSTGSVSGSGTASSSGSTPSNSTSAALASFKVGNVAFAQLVACTMMVVAGAALTL